MQLLAQIKKDMDFNNTLYNLIEVLKEISISQYHSLDKRIKSFEFILRHIENFFSMIDLVQCQNPLLNTGTRPPGVIAVTSDTGLLGGLNMQVMALALREVEEHKARLIIVGERGQMYASDYNFEFAPFKGVKDETRFAQALELRDYIVNEERNLRLGPVRVIYPHPLSVVSQQVRTIQLLPFLRSEIETSRAHEDIVMESSVDDIAWYLVYFVLGHRLNEVFGLSRLSELSARFVHLENCKTKIEQLNKQLKLQYFRQRHELIDRTMRELFAARVVFE
jgi:ATP synthase F1 gamma subunit